jgi:serine/threonine protein kinase
MRNIPVPCAKSIFLAALELPSPSEWPAFLESRCGGDTELRLRVEALLEAHAQTSGAFDRFTPRDQETAEHPFPIEGPGQSIGPYQLLEPIGEGGMGVVYMAEQWQPIRRKVALKIIKPGMDTKQVIARFEAERQALALMDHSNIAKVLDAGATESGRPYFVMELVKGIPITEYCDREKLSIADRLELFVLVCQAVQHAHQKGIIHRDIKPSNVMVTLQEGVPVPKVIDFGVAKAMGHSLTEKTLYTGFAQLVGTPMYMSPEQAEMSGLDVDTRSDIYSLGVLLYELLTGSTPFDRETLRKAAFDEVRRIIREEEPATPSARLSTLGESLSTVSARRKAEPRQLSRAVRGELDWIVMKALGEGPDAKVRDGQ